MPQRIVKVANFSTTRNMVELHRSIWVHFHLSSLSLLPHLHGLYQDCLSLLLLHSGVLFMLRQHGGRHSSRKEDHREGGREAGSDSSGPLLVAKGA